MAYKVAMNMHFLTLQYNWYSQTCKVPLAQLILPLKILVYCKTWNMEWNGIWNGMELAMNKIILRIFI